MAMVKSGMTYTLRISTRCGQPFSVLMVSKAPLTDLVMLYSPEYYLFMAKLHKCYLE